MTTCHLPLVEIQEGNLIVGGGSVLIHIPPSDHLGGYETVRIFVRVTGPDLRGPSLRTEGYPRHQSDGSLAVCIHYSEQFDRPGTLLKILYTVASAGSLLCSH